jgi:chromosome segregation ATPase
MELLYDGEFNRPWVWQYQVGAGTFDQFMVANHLGKPTVYREWCQTKKEYGGPFVSKVGKFSSRVNKVKDKSKRDQAARELYDTASNSGVPVSDQHATNIVNHHRTSERIPRVSKYRDRIDNLKAENKRLKAENKRLKAENERLKAENERLKAGNERLKAGNEQLHERIQELEEEIRSPEYNASGQVDCHV